MFKLLVEICKSLFKKNEALKDERELLDHTLQALSSLKEVVKISTEKAADEESRNNLTVLVDQIENLFLQGTEIKKELDDLSKSEHVENDAHLQTQILIATNEYIHSTNNYIESITQFLKSELA